MERNRLAWDAAMDLQLVTMICDGLRSDAIAKKLGYKAAASIDYRCRVGFGIPVRQLRKLSASGYTQEGILLMCEPYKPLPPAEPQLPFDKPYSTGERIDFALKQLESLAEVIAAIKKELGYE